MAESEERSHAPEQSERPQRRVGQSWESYIDEQIRTAQERGEFDRLPGAGRPLQLDVNPLAGERALAFSLLKGQGVAPQEIELGREIDKERQRAEDMLAALRRQRDALRRRHVGPFASERRAYNAQVRRVLGEYADLMRASNGKALSLNIMAPPPLHRRLIDVEERVTALRDEFPLLAE
jgi:DnaJ homolog subfamily C member 28